MRRRGSVSFVVEVMRRRFPQNGATTSDLDRKSGSRISPIGAGGLSVTPLIERERVSDPTIEAAKIAAKRFFSTPGSPQSARADHWSDPSARGFIPRVEPARPADSRCKSPPATWWYPLRHNRTDKRKSHDPDAFCKVSSWKIQSTLCFDEKPKNDQPAAGRVARAREASSPTGPRPQSRPTADRAPRPSPRNPARVLRNWPFRRTSSSQAASCAAERSRPIPLPPSICHGTKQCGAGRRRRRRPQDELAACVGPRTKGPARSDGHRSGRPAEASVRRASLREPQPKKALAR